MAVRTEPIAINPHSSTNAALSSRRRVSDQLRPLSNTASVMAAVLRMTAENSRVPVKKPETRGNPSRIEL
ncbi:hypothetical protein D3C80_1916730 [compost metagenome]